MSAFRPDGWTTPELAQAVERGQLELHYQPVVDLRSGEIVGAEAHKADQAAPALYGPEKGPVRPARAS